MTGAGLDLATVTMLVALGAGLTFLALCIVFGGFFAERRLRELQVEANLAGVPEAWQTVPGAETAAPE